MQNECVDQTVWGMEEKTKQKQKTHWELSSLLILLSSRMWRFLTRSKRSSSAWISASSYIHIRMKVKQACIKQALVRTWGLFVTEPDNITQIVRIVDYWKSQYWTLQSTLQNYSYVRVPVCQRPFSDGPVGVWRFLPVHDTLLKSTCKMIQKWLE